MNSEHHPPVRPTRCLTPRHVALRSPSFSRGRRVYSALLGKTALPQTLHQIQTNMNVFRLTGDLSHLAAIIILLLKIWKSRSCAGERALGTSSGCFSLCELHVWVKSVWGIVYVAADPLVCVVNSCTRPHLSRKKQVLVLNYTCLGFNTRMWVAMLLDPWCVSCMAYKSKASEECRKACLTLEFCSIWVIRL